MTNKITKDQITKMTKQQAEENAKRVNDAVIIPVYVAVSLDEEGRISGVSNARLNDTLGKVLDRPEVPFTEGQYQTYKTLAKNLEATKVVNSENSAYKAYNEFINTITEEQLMYIRERFEAEMNRPDYKEGIAQYKDGIKKYDDDLKKY